MYRRLLDSCVDVEDGREMSFANTEVGGSGDGMRCNGGMALKRLRSTSATSRLFRCCASIEAARKSDCAASADAVIAVVET